MKLLLIGILLLRVSFANCQTDSIWVEGDKACMNVQKAIQFAKMKDSLLVLYEDLIENESFLSDCRVLVRVSSENIEGLRHERDLLIKQISELEAKLGLEQDKRMIKERDLKSIMLVNNTIIKERRKFKVQRDILIGGGVCLGITVVVLIIINAL